MINVKPDKPAQLANRIYDRLKRERLLHELPDTHNIHLIEVIADEIHQDILDETIRVRESGQ